MLRSEGEGGHLILEGFRSLARSSMRVIVPQENVSWEKALLVVVFDVRIWWKRESRPVVMLVGRVRYGYIDMSTSPCTIRNIKLSPERSICFCTISQPRFAIISVALLVRTRGLSPFYF